MYIFITFRLFLHFMFFNVEMAYPEYAQDLDIELHRFTIRYFCFSKQYFNLLLTLTETLKRNSGYDKDIIGYTNEDNPFGDEKLLDTFVWRKKMDRDGNTHLTETEQRQMIQK